MKSSLVLVLSLLALFSCQSKWEKEIQKQVDDINSLKAALTAELGVQVDFAKISSNGAGERYIVYKNTATGEYMAYNITKWDSKYMTTYSQYIPDGDDVIHDLDKKSEWTKSGYWEDIKEYQNVTTSQYVTEYRDVTRNEYDFGCSCYRDVTSRESYSFWKDITEWKEVKVGERYIDTSGYVNYYYGGGFRFENSGSGSKDLDVYAANREQMSEAGITNKFKNEFSLSTDRAKELARLSMQYMKLENTRALTVKEKDQFAMKSLGVSMNQVESALRSRAMGDEAAYEDLLNQAAKVNKTTPEMIGKFFNEIVE